MLQIPSNRTERIQGLKSSLRTSARPNRWGLRAAAALLAPLLILLAGCAGNPVVADPSNGTFSISPGTASIDTNCTGCNVVTTQGKSAEQFSATLASGSEATVTWTVSGGDANSGPGTISADGQYVPPSYLTADRVQVIVTATLNAGTVATSVLTVTPGFLQPLTPENSALGANGQVTVTGYLAEAGGSRGISFALANSATGSSGGFGTLGATTCQRGASAFTFCTVTYSAPASLTATNETFVVATIGGGANSRATANLLLNTAGVTSNPASHQSDETLPIALGTSGGNNNDYDVTGNQIADCCSGTLGSLLEDTSGRQYLLSNNHVLARSDQAAVGDAIIQPGLIDNNCTPNGDGPGTTLVGSLTGWLPLSSSATNADAAIAQVDPGGVNTNGNILELGTRQQDGTLSAAPPGTSSTAGVGEPAQLAMTVAKSGRTTGLTCANISALSLDVRVDYFLDCAETEPYLTKTYTNQLGITGNQFSDAGDSGSLVVDASNAEPVGLFFAGGTDSTGVSEGVANPAPEVINELNAQLGNGSRYTFVGGADHAVSCLNYGDDTVATAQARTLTAAENARAQLALADARTLVNPSTGVLGVALGKSSDRVGEAAIVVYVDETMSPSVPTTVGNVRTIVVPANSHAVAVGSAPQTPWEATAPAPLTSAVLNSAIAAKLQVVSALMKQNPSFFGVGVGQSLDNPRQAALVVYVDRKKIPAQLPQIINGLRARYIVMDRLHVTRSYDAPFEQRMHCMPHARTSPGLDGLLKPKVLGLQ